MKKRRLKTRPTASWTVLIVVMLVGLIVGSDLAAGQSQEDATRRLWDTAFIRTAKQVKRRRKSARIYRLATPKLPVSEVAGDSVVGVTVWRLRRPTASDSGERLLVQDGPDSETWVPERISANTKLAPGERVRVSVEAARAGYLYVIDREQYADGTLSEPYLIFPTTRTLNGDNKVDVGKVIEIPAQDDGPPYFTLKRSRPDQVAEVLSVLITPGPLENLEIKSNAQMLPAAQVADWEKQWSTQVGSVELESGAGKTWTKDEKDAGANRDLVLNAHAPAPQVLYYRANARRSDPMLVKVQLRYKPSLRKPAR